MAESINDALADALTLANGSKFQRGDIICQSYPHHGDDKVRIFKSKAASHGGFLQILVAGNLAIEGAMTDKDSAKDSVKRGLLTKTEQSQILAKVSEMAASDLKTDAPLATVSESALPDGASP